MAWVKQKKYPGSNMNMWVLNNNVIIEKFDDDRSTYNPYKLRKHGEFVKFWPERKGWEKARAMCMSTRTATAKTGPVG
jgi:hypothetical protein